MPEPRAGSKSPVRATVRKDVEAKAELLALSKGMRSRLMANVKASIKSLILDDPDMWKCARSVINAAVDEFLEDVEHEVEMSLESVLLQQKADARAVEGPQGTHWLLQTWFNVRAVILYRFLPYNKSIYGKLKDWRYVLMYVATLLPIHGVRTVFFSIILLGLVYPRPDEFQLINFILMFKGMQFVTSGLVFMARGAFSYWCCYSYHKADLLECINLNGPGASTSLAQLTDYLGSVVLVWLAFGVLLAYCHQPLSATTSVVINAGEGTPPHPRVGLRAVLNSFSRLRHLLYYDMACFTMSLLILGILGLSNCGDLLWHDPSLYKVLSDRQFRSNIFWCLVLYSLASWPFMLFATPGLQQVLTHSIPTGFNQNGACVPFSLVAPPAQGAAADEGGSSWVGAFAASVVASALRTAAKGRVARGGEEHGEHMPGDFRRGLWMNFSEPIVKLGKAAGAAIGAPQVGARPFPFALPPPPTFTLPPPPPWWPWKPPQAQALANTPATVAKTDPEAAARSSREPLLRVDDAEEGASPRPSLPWPPPWRSQKVSQAGSAGEPLLQTACGHEKLNSRCIPTLPGSPSAGTLSWRICTPCAALSPTADAQSVAPVRVFVARMESREGAVFYRISAAPNVGDPASPTPSRSSRSARCVWRGPEEFAELAEALAAKGEGGCLPLPLPVPNGLGAEPEVPAAELAAWLEALLRDRRSRGPWAAPLEEFLRGSLTPKSEEVHRVDPRVAQWGRSNFACF